MGLREKILALNKAKALQKQTQSMKNVQQLANRHRGEIWDCSICGEKIEASKYPKHYFKCKMKLELGKRGY